MVHDVILIAEKRLTLNLRSRRILLATGLAVLFAAVAARVAVDQYRIQKELYDAERLAYRLELDGDGWRTYSQVRVVVGMHPRPLGIVAGGVENRLGSTVVLRGRYGPPKVGRRAGENFLQAVEGFDFAQLGGVLLTLTALLVTFDVVVGEKAAGTLDLVRSNAVTWRRIVIGEYVAAVLTLLPATVLVFAVVAAVMKAVRAVELSGEVWLGLMTQWGFLVLLVSAFSALGILCSTMGRSAGGALVAAFGAWVLLVAIYPDASASVGRLLAGSESREARALSESALLTQLEPRAESERSVASSREDPLAPPEEAWRWHRRLGSVAPFTAYEIGASRVAGTDIGAYTEFLDGARALDRRLEAWQTARVAESPERERRWNWGTGRLNLEGLPAAEAASGDLVRRLRGAFVPAIGLLLWNVIPLAVALVRRTG